MFGEKQLPTGDALLKECKRRGINVDNIYHAQTGRIIGPAQREMQQLLLISYAQRREKVMFFITIVAVIAAVVSAIAAVTK